MSPDVIPPSLSVRFTPINEHSSLEKNKVLISHINKLFKTKHSKA